MFAPPVAIIGSIVGLFKDESMKCAIAGLVIAGVTCCLWLLPMLLC